MSPPEFGHKLLSPQDSGVTIEVSMFRRTSVVWSAIPIVALLGVFVARHRLKPLPAGLTVDEVLAWRLPYNELIGADEKVALEKFGPPDRSPTGSVTWEG